MRMLYLKTRKSQGVAADKDLISEIFPLGSISNTLFIEEDNWEVLL